MKIEEAIAILKRHNEWRRGADIPMTDVTEAIDTVVEHYADGSNIALTWQDVRRIVQIADDFINYTEPTTMEEEYYEQVLKRFKDE